MDPIDNKSRRGLLKAVFGGVFTALMLPLRRAGAVDERQLAFFHTHTGKRLDVVYKRNGEFVPEALSVINTFLSDFRTGDVADMDPHLLDLIYDLREATGSESTYEVISAYRSPATNDMLRQTARAAWPRTASTCWGKGRSTFDLTDVDLTKCATPRSAMQRGGVGYYASPNFVHIDTGRVRRW